MLTRASHMLLHTLAPPPPAERLLHLPLPFARTWMLMPACTWRSKKIIFRSFLPSHSPVFYSFSMTSKLSDVVLRLHRRHALQSYQWAKNVAVLSWEERRISSWSACRCRNSFAVTPAEISDFLLKNALLWLCPLKSAGWSWITIAGCPRWPLTSVSPPTPRLCMSKHFIAAVIFIFISWCMLNLHPWPCLSVFVLIWNAAV